MVKLTGINRPRRGLAPLLAAVSLALFAVFAFWMMNNYRVFTDLLEAKQERDIARQNLERQRRERARTVHNAVIARKGKLPVQAQARDDLSMCKDGEIVILIDEENRTSSTLLAPENIGVILNKTSTSSTVSQYR